MFLNDLLEFFFCSEFFWPWVFFDMSKKKPDLDSIQICLPVGRADDGGCRPYPTGQGRGHQLWGCAGEGRSRRNQVDTSEVLAFLFNPLSKYIGCEAVWVGCPDVARRASGGSHGRHHRWKLLEASTLLFWITAAPAGVRSGIEGAVISRFGKPPLIGFFTSREAAWSCRTVGRQKRDLWI